MKTYKSFALALIALLGAVTVSSQTADEIINKYIKVIGGKEFLTKITSVYTESTMTVMGNQGNVKTTTLNGKGMKQEMDIMGANMTTCYTDKGGWSVNPMTGSTSAEDMPDTQYKSGRDQIVIGAPFIYYAEKGYKAELTGSEKVDSINAIKIKFTSPDSITAVYYFDPGTYYLIRSVQQEDMQGQKTNIIISYADYKPIDGYTIPHKMGFDIADGQFTMEMTINKVELNKPTSDTIFIKPR
jgi:hypothetical protein